MIQFARKKAIELIDQLSENPVDTLYSEDLGDGERYDTVTVVNPFA